MNLTPEGIRKILSLNIKTNRKILGISQEKLAEIADLSAQTINDIEGCRMWVSDKTIAKLCRALHVEAYQLLLPCVEETGKKPLTTSHILQNLQQNLKENIDLQFSELFKSDLL
ncbi:MAG: helix-turn-helix transcriptional regulator [Treponema sp.]|jgi:transcriptional regulator with XRE-family HTH domain|nr:helix-turn-helix transcriptional regulator [Treponema sp.]